MKHKGEVKGLTYDKVKYGKVIWAYNSVNEMIEIYMHWKKYFNLYFF